MHVRFLSLFGEFDIEGLCDKTGGEILKQLGELTDKNISLFHIFYEGYIIDSTTTPASFGATDDDELLCIVDVVMKDVALDTSCSVIANNKSPFTTFRQLNLRSDYQDQHNNNNNTNTNTNNNNNNRRNKQNQEEETDAQYASRMIASGEYDAPLTEVADHPCLHDLFLTSLRDCNQRLYQYFINNDNAFMDAVRTASSRNLNKQPRFKLITEARNHDILNILEIACIDYEDALRQYLEANMDIYIWTNTHFN